MKKTIVVTMLSVLSISSIAQSINKKYPYKSEKDRDHHYYCTSYPVGDKKILSIYAYKESVLLRLFDDELNLIKDKRMTRETKGPYDVNFYLTKNNVFILEKKVIKKVVLDEELKAKTLSMPDLPKPRPGSDFPESKRPQFHVDAKEQNYYYGVNEDDVYFKSVSFESKKSKKYKATLNEKEKVTVSDFATFKNSDVVAVTRVRKAKGEKLFEIALHDAIGKEIEVINRLENGYLKETVNYANHNDEVYVLGNYKEKQSVNEAYFIINEIRHKKPKYEGVYMHTLNSDKIIDKYYKYSDFDKLISQMEIDEIKQNDLLKYRFELQEVITNTKEKIVIGTLNEDLFKFMVSSGGGGNDVYIGKELTYILIFGVNENGDLLWHQVIPLNWLGHERYEVTSAFHLIQVDNFHQRFVTVEKNGDKIKCHYSFKDNMTSFEIDNGQIVNKKQTPFDIGNIIKDNNSVYWYDNFYFNHNPFDGLELDKLEFNK